MPIQIPEELAVQIEQGARRAGESTDIFLREAVLSRIEDLGDIDIATERLANPGKRLSFEQVVDELGLDD